MRIAVLSDTHNLLRPEIVSYLQGCDHILHGGDISSRVILEKMEQIAQVRAVRGNNDKDWAEGLPEYLDFELGGLHFYMTHKKKDLPEDLSSYDIVIFGHSHRYDSTWIDHTSGRRTLLLNPGSCGPRRFYQPVTMAILTIDDDGWIVKRIEIPHDKKEKVPEVSGTDIRKVIEMVVSETRKGHSVEKIARRHKVDYGLTEQIVRLYVTHPGVTVEGIMSKMGL